jgi:hypothetical protein
LPTSAAIWWTLAQAPSIERIDVLGAKLPG